MDPLKISATSRNRANNGLRCFVLLENARNTLPREGGWIDGGSSEEKPLPVGYTEVCHDAFLFHPFDALRNHDTADACREPANALISFC